MDKLIEQTTQQTRILEERRDILIAESIQTDEEALKREILNYLLDEESDFHI